ncbi:LexA/Signal peptidase [Marasmius fiardii PR-910]|nr:LexA/Signal peptidase [Marasmius fiardii PR-910]
MLKWISKRFKCLWPPAGRPSFGVWRYAYWAPTFLVLGEYFYCLKTVSGRSMQPTLNPDSSPSKDIALFNRFAIHTLRQFQRDDIVALKSPENPERMLVKRIIALPGDRVKTLPPFKETEVVVPPGHVWIEGDEPFHSDDSNRFGPVSVSLIESRMVCVIWPLSRFGLPRDPLTLETVGLGDRAVRRYQWRQSRVIPDK